MSVLMLWTKCKLNNAELVVNLYSEQRKNKAYYEETREFEKWQVSNLFLNRVNPLRNKDTLPSKGLDIAIYNIEWAASIQRIGFCKCWKK